MIDTLMVPIFILMWLPFGSPEETRRPTVIKARDQQGGDWGYESGNGEVTIQRTNHSQASQKQSCRTLMPLPTTLSWLPSAACLILHGCELTLQLFRHDACNMQWVLPTQVLRNQSRREEQGGSQDFIEELIGCIRIYMSAWWLPQEFCL